MRQKLVEKHITKNIDREEFSIVNKETIKIKYHTDEIEKLRYIDGKSYWLDLRSAEDVELKAGDLKLISVGVSMELPQSYRGDHDIWRYPVDALRDTVIHKNDRICQFRIMKHQPTIEFEEVEHLEGEDRNGFGSTGKQ